jgi:hypothetical protein
MDGQYISTFKNLVMVHCQFLNIQGKSGETLTWRVKPIKVAKSDIFKVPALSLLVSFSFIMVMTKIDISSIIRIELYIYIYIYMQQFTNLTSEIISACSLTDQMS